MEPALQHPEIVGVRLSARGVVPATLMKPQEQPLEEMV
jgi:hypothetical protein